MQPGPLGKLDTIALALILAKRVVPLGPLFITYHGERAAYRSCLGPAGPLD